jgi:GTP-binding protein
VANQAKTTGGRGRLAASALSFAEMPADGWTEVAFMGRSNAGKSSLINTLLGERAAHVSNTPGRTQRINFFAMGKWYLVDLPGFGYAKVSKSERSRFGQAVERYLTERQTLAAGVLIQDARRDPQEEEHMVVDWAASRNILLVIVASKIDRMNRAEQSERHQALNAQYGRPVLFVSNRTGEGIQAVRQVIVGLGLPL